MSHFDLFTNDDSPRRISDASPLSTSREGERPQADLGVSS